MKNNIILLLLYIFSLTSCADSIERLRRVGKAPELGKLDIPETDRDKIDHEEEVIIHQERKKKTNSLWQPVSLTFFRDNRAWKVGDILKVVIEVKDNAELANSTKQNRSGSNALSMPTVFGKEKAIAGFISKKGDAADLLSTKSGKTNAGSGNISRKEDIKTTIAAVVTQVLNNGNLVILGRQEIRVNHELREIKVTGVIRPKDISNDNSVHSNQIAEARISYGGRGVISDVQQPKVGDQIADIISPF